MAVAAVDGKGVLVAIGRRRIGEEAPGSWDRARAIVRKIGRARPIDGPAATRRRANPLPTTDEWLGWARKAIGGRNCLGEKAGAAP